MRDSLEVDQSCESREGVIKYGVRGSGAPILLVMGFMARGRAWRSQVEELSKDYQVAWFDHLGVGESVGPPAKSMVDFAHDCLALMDHLSWGRAHVVGISMGGMISQELALLAPERIISLSLIVTHYGGVSKVLPTAKGIPRFLKAQLSRDPQQRIEALRALLVPESVLQESARQGRDEEINEKLREDFTPKPPSKTRVNHVKAILKHDTRARLSSIQCPALVIQAQEDLLVHPKHSESLAQAIPNAKLISFEHAGHGIVRQSNIDLNAVLREHLTEAASASPPPS